MKKTVLKSTIVCLTFVLAGISSFAQISLQNAAERGPVGAPAHVAPSPLAMARIANQWDVLFNYTVSPSNPIGTLGFAGMCFVGNEYWVAKWASDTVCIFDAAGVYVRMFRITGVTGIRSMTYDGTNIYCGINTTSVKKITTVSTGPTLVSSITMPLLTGSALYNTTRWITYDATANGGAGGFWIGNYDTDILQVSMTGTLLNTVTAANHGVGGMYGGAVDNYSPGGPYIWVCDQNGLGGADLIQINLASGLQTGVVHDIGSDVGLSSTGPLGGGIFMYDGAWPLTLMGCLQGDPNLLFGYDLNVAVGLSEPATTNFLSVNPSLASTMIDVKLDKQNNNQASIRIFDAQGCLVFDRLSKGANNYIDVSNYSNGIYVVKVICDNGSYTTKFVKN